MIVPAALNKGTETLIDSLNESVPVILPLTSPGDAQTIAINGTAGTPRDRSAYIMLGSFLRGGHKRVAREYSVPLGTKFWYSPTNASSIKSLEKLQIFSHSATNEGDPKMKTQSVNSLAEAFEVDRGTLVRALKNTPPDAEKTPGRPTYKISTVATALEVHRRSTGRADSRRARSTAHHNNDTWQDPLLARIFEEYDSAEAAMRELTALDARRNAAIAMAPMIARVDRAIRERGEANGQDSELVGLRADKLFMLALRGFEGPCSWTESETWDAMNINEDE